MSSKKTLLAVNKRSWKATQPGGAEINLQNTITGLNQSDYDIHILVGLEGGARREEVEDHITIHRIGLIDNLSGLPYLIQTYICISLFFYYYYFSIGPDIVYSVNTPLPWFFLTNTQRIPIYHHISIDSFNETHGVISATIGRLIQRLGILFDKSVPTIAVSASTARELERYGHDRDSIIIIPNGVDVSELCPSTESKTPTILFLGKLAKNKGADRIPEIHERVNETVDESVYVEIAGPSGSEEQKIVKYCSSSNRANYRGYVDFNTKVELLQKSWVLVAPSRVEGWGIVVIEANACGTPVVGTDVKGLRDSINDGETGFIAEEDPEKIAKSICTLLTDDSLRNKMGRQGYQWAQSHSWENSARELDSVFQERM